MKKNFVTVLGALCVLSAAGLSGCSNSDSDVPKVDQATMKQQPGANVPPAASNGGTAAQTKRAKSGD